MNSLRGLGHRMHNKLTCPSHFLGRWFWDLRAFKVVLTASPLLCTAHVIRKLLRSRHFVLVTTPAGTKFVGLQIPILSAMACVSTSTPPSS